MSAWLCTLVDINEYLAVDSGGYVNEYSKCSNCSDAEASQSSCDGVRMNRSARGCSVSVKCFELRTGCSAI